VVPGFVINDGNSGKNYAVTLSADSTGVINKALLTIAAGTNTKTYDASTAAAATPALTGLIPGDTVTGMVEAYIDINAGAGKTLSVSTYVINDGNNGNNYLVTTMVAATGVITPAPLNIAAMTNIKTYDGTKAAATTPTVVGLLGNDSVTNRAEAYVSANAGFNQTLSVTAYTINDGTGGNNYAVTTLTATTGVINKAPLLIAATTSTKIYDSKTIAAATPTVAGLIGPDSVTGLSESYASANAGAGKSLIVNAGYTVNDGNGGNNYTVTTLADVTGSITRAPLTLTATANTKVYDSKTTAAALPVASGLIGSDSISGLSETYSSANTGTGKVLNVSSAYSLQDGNGGNNYAVTTAPSSAGQVTKAPLTITAITSTITYNATTTAGAIPTVSGLIGGDSVSGLSESFSDSSLGTGKTLSVNPGYSVSDGNNGNNYTVATASNATGAIVPGPVNKFVVTIPGGTTVVAGVPFNFTIQAADFYGNPVVNYAGPITASTNVFDPLGSFPISGPLQASNIGYGFFLGTLKTTGTYTVNIGAAGGIAGASVPITVIPAATSYFSVTTAPSTITGAPINVTVSAFDSYSNINYNYNGTIKLSSNDGSALLGGNYSFTTGPGLDNGTHTFSVTLKTPGTQFITALDVNTPTLSNTSTGTLARGLQVASVTPTATGFTVSFDKAFIPGDITLYGATTSAVADVVLTAKSGGKLIHGSILVDPSNQSLTFKATSSYLMELNASAAPATVSTVLPDDTYTITLLSGSGSNGFIDALGAHLDGASNSGAANYTTTFTTKYQANATPVLGVPDFARGPDDNTPIQAPTFKNGIPIMLYNAANVTDVTFSLSYNSALLHPTGTLSGNSGLSDATSATSSLVLVSNAGGVATFHYTDTSPQSATPLQPLVLGDLTATVPSANFAISSITETGNVVTVTTSSNETFSAGQSIAINGVTNSVYNSNTHGNGLFTIVNTISANRFTFNLPVANQAPSSGGVAGVAALGLYQQKELLQPGNIIINKGAITGAIASSGVHVNSYIGDVNGDGVIDGLDKIAANIVAQGKGNGFSSFAQLDPTIVGDPANDLSVDAGDVTTIDSFVAALNPAQIPLPPTQQPASNPSFFPKADLSSPNASDPTLSLASGEGSVLNGGNDSPLTTNLSLSVMIDHPDPEGSTGLNAASLALTFDPEVLTVSAEDITLGSIPSRSSGWQLSAVVDQATGQIGIQLYSSTPIATNQGGSLVNIIFHPLAASERRGVNSPVPATTTVQLVNSATPNGQHFDTGLTDSQSGMILSPGINQVEVPTGLEPSQQPAFASAATPTDVKSEPDQQTQASMFLGPLLLSDSEEPTAIRLLANGSAADQAPVPHQAPANLIVSGALAFQPSRDVLVTRPWDVQVIQIASSPEFASRSTQPIVDRLFLALAHAREVAVELSLLAPIWDAFSQLDWLEASSIVREKEMRGWSDATSTAGDTETAANLDQVFRDLGNNWGDFDAWGEF
jgi:YDG domain